MRLQFSSVTIISALLHTPLTDALSLDISDIGKTPVNPVAEIPI